MGLPKGRTNNKAGRKPGALNKMSKDMRQNITDFLQDNFDEVLIEWKKLRGKEKLFFYKDLLPYAVPRMQSIEMQEVESKENRDLSKMTDDELDAYHAKIVAIEDAEKGTKKT